MSGFKTPTAMSPPKAQTKSPSISTTSNMIPAESRISGLQSSMYPFDSAAALMRAFEKLKSPKSSQIEVVSPCLPPIVTNRATIQWSKSGTNGSTNTTVSSPGAGQGGSATKLEASINCSSSLSSPIPSTRRSSDSVERGRPHTSPHQMIEMHQTTSPTCSTATFPDSPLKAYGHISDGVGRNSPYSKMLRQTPPSPELEVYKRHESNGRLMVCEAREEHCSNTVTSFVGERTGLRCMAELKAELLRILGQLSEAGHERAKADLKVVTVDIPAPGYEYEDDAKSFRVTCWSALLPGI